jgi:8-oxo-dGTP pyrophosphatase MutT (NUDIX family)
LKDFSLQLKSRLSPLYETWEETPFASVALVLMHAQEHGAGLVLIERAHHPLDPWSGQMALPGGRADLGELPHQTALRECYEELGLVVDDAFGRLHSVPAVGKGRFQDFHIHPHLFQVSTDWEILSAQLRPDPREVQSFTFVSFEELLEPKRHGNFVSSDPRFLNAQLPYFECEGKKVWGLTYHILGQLFKNAEGLRFTSGQGKMQTVEASHWGVFPQLDSHKK